jgi:hypothetical protein
LRKGGEAALMPTAGCLQHTGTEVETRMGQTRGAVVAKASCESCFFHQNLLCAISQTGPCATFRPDHPEGLRPPSQLRFVFRQERRMQVAWSFPSPNEQVALHA